MPFGSGVSDRSVSTGASLKPAAPTDLGATIQGGNQVRSELERVRNLATAYIVTRYGRQRTVHAESH